MQTIRRLRCLAYEVINAIQDTRTTLRAVYAEWAVTEPSSWQARLTGVVSLDEAITG